MLDYKFLDAYYPNDTRLSAQMGLVPGREPFEASKCKDDIIAWIQQYFINSNGKNAIVGISGGKDSSVVAALCVAAIGFENVLGVLMPNGKQHDIDVARNLVGHLGIQSIEVNIEDAVKGLNASIETAIAPGKITQAAKMNTPARIRMATLYAIAQSVGGGRVANTCNLSEDWVGYSTRYGDSAGDFAPIANLVVDEVKAVGKSLKLPVEFTQKIPEDGLCGKTDEENLGFTYAVLDRYIRSGEIDDMSVKFLIDRKHNYSKFKIQQMPRFGGFVGFEE